MSGCPRNKLTTAEETAAERLEVQRLIEATPAAIFRVLCDPQGHVAIDSTGMLMDATGEPVTKAGDSFVVHMDREALNDFPLGRYDVTVTITTLVPDTEIAWGITGRIRPQVGHTYGYRLEPAPPRQARTPARSSPRTTTGPRSTRTGARPASSRSSPRPRCAPRWASWPGPSPAATPAARGKSGLNQA